MKKKEITVPFRKVIRKLLQESRDEIMGIEFNLEEVQDIVAGDLTRHNNRADEQRQRAIDEMYEEFEEGDEADEDEDADDLNESRRRRLGKRTPKKTQLKKSRIRSIVREELIREMGSRAVAAANKLLDTQANGRKIGVVTTKSWCGR